MLRDKMQWLYFGDILSDEAHQARDEGKTVRQEEIDAILAIPAEAEREARARAWIEAVEAQPLPETLAKNEPETLEGIRALLSPEAARTYPTVGADMETRLTAAWAGRMSGCLLGIPVECWTRERITGFVQASGQDPRAGYLSSRVEPDVRARFDVRDPDEGTSYDRQLKGWINNVQCFPVDDDTNYTVAALRLLERRGRGFTVEQVAENLLFAIPVMHVCTAERVAYRNLLNCILPPRCATYANPYREWIGAQIRADFFGYINPGDPSAAAEMAWRDASVTHVRNGAYAEMYVAALISLAPCGMAAEEMIRTALLQIPPRCRLAKAVNELLLDVAAGMDYPAFTGKLHSRYREQDWFNWGHAIPNALIVTAILAFFGDSHADAIAEAVLIGFDTDCNAATVGSIVGLRTARVEPRWLAYFPPVLHTSVHGYETLTLQELVRKTCALLPEQR